MTMNTPDDATQVQEAELVARLRQGDRGALEQLYLRYFDRLYSLVFHQVGRNKSVAEDIVQETFLVALKSAVKFRSHSTFYTWLCSIAYHKITDFYRQSRGFSHTAMEATQIMDTYHCDTGSGSYSLWHLVATDINTYRNATRDSASDSPGDSTSTVSRNTITKRNGYRHTTGAGD